MGTYFSKKSNNNVVSNIDSNVVVSNIDSNDEENPFVTRPEYFGRYVYLPFSPRSRPSDLNSEKNENSSQSSNEWEIEMY